MKQEEFVAKILEALLPMPDVNAIKSKGHIVLYKEGVMLDLKINLTNLTVMHSCLELLSPGG